MRHIVICGLPGSKIFFHIISWMVRFSIKKFEHKTCVLVFSTTFAWNISYSVNNWTRNDKNVYWVRIKSDFNETWILFKDFRKIFKYKISWKSFQWKPSCSMRTNRRTNMTKLIVAFLNSANALKNHQLMLGREIKLASSENHTKHTNAQ